MRKFCNVLIILLFLDLFVCAQSPFDKKIFDAVQKLRCAEPTNETPVTVNAGLVIETDSIAVIIKACLAPQWHIYHYVPANMPYIPLELILELPEGMQAAGKWNVSPPFPSPTDQGVLIYEKQAWFVHKISRKAGANGKIKTGLYYQTCDLQQCLPPIETTFDLLTAAYSTKKSNDKKELESNPEHY